MGSVIPDFDDSDPDNVESFFVDPEFDVVDGVIYITPPVRWASDENAGYAT